jgi:hypothetical protein
MSRKRRERQKEQAKAMFVTANDAGNYIGPAMLMANAALAGGKVIRGRLSTMEIRHDDWCQLLAGTGSCNCNPEVCEPRIVHRPEDN